MPRDMDDIAYVSDQAARARRLFSAVVMAALDDAIKDEEKHGTGITGIASWARSRHGRTILSNAGIDPDERTVALMIDYVTRGARGEKAA
ncbi:MAG: DUF6280 family protein [Pseudomonadota bacterium]